MKKTGILKQNSFEKLRYPRLDPNPKMDFDEILVSNKNSRSSFTIEPEDVFADSPEDNAPHIVDVDNRKYIWALFGLAIIGLGIILSRSFYLQIIKGDFYQALALDNKVKIVRTKASRGIIYDRNNQPLVQNIPSFDLVLNVGDFKRENKPQIYQELSQSLNEPLDSVEKYFSDIDFSMLEPQVIKQNIEYDKAFIIQAKSKELPGIEIQINAIRNYSDAAYFSHILGYTGKLNKQEYEKNKDYLFDDSIGKTGLESIYEKELRGRYGIDQLETDSTGKVKRSLVSEESQAGNNLMLTVDNELQKKLQDSLGAMLEKLNLRKAAGAAIDPRDGSVRALVSLPSFDNNLFSQGISQEDYERLLNDPDRPLFNRTISGEYPPGSTFKPMMAASALEEKVITAQREIQDFEGKLVIANPYNPSAAAVFNDWKAHGMVSLRKAIAESCNVYFYTIGGGYGDIKGLGIDRIKKYAELFGLNKLTNIDLPFERKGLIPDTEWKQKTKNEKWYIGDTYNSSIGQGDVAVTPIQLANYIAAVANGGTLYQPHLLDKVLDAGDGLVKKFNQVVLSKDFISRNNLKEVQAGMRQTVTSGSGRALDGLIGKNGKVAVAGKTGTAQFKGDQTHAWFVSYAPYENPELALVILVEEGGEGHTAAVPVAKEVLEWYFNR